MIGRGSSGHRAATWTGRDRCLIRQCVTGAVLIAVMSLAAAACSAPRDPIVVDEGYITIENQTGRHWRNIKVTVNHHYSGSVTVLGAGGRLNAPLSQLQTAFGQKFDRGRQSVFKVEVTATDEDGQPVTLLWGKPE